MHIVFLTTLLPMGFHFFTIIVNKTLTYINNYTK
uniref:Uncharacterized protein n=1 Tax=Anguilla anguilla TaxID=7936 RepID=A0A0E9Q5K2_ANGAN